MHGPVSTSGDREVVTTALLGPYLNNLEVWKQKNRTHTPEEKQNNNNKKQ